jgi:hypothetical protein
MSKATRMRIALGGIGAVLLGVLLAGDHLVLGQKNGDRPSSEKKKKRRPKKSLPQLASLEDMLAMALRHNPDIRLAEVKLRDDETDLNRTRLRVMQRIIALHHSLQSLQAAVEAAQAKLKRTRSLVRRGAVQAAQLEEAEHELARAKAKLEEARSELPFLLGKRNDGLSEEVLRNEVQIGLRRSRGSAIPATMARKLRKALETTFEVNFQDEPLGDVLKHLAEKTPGVAFQQNLALRDLGQIRVSVRLGKVSLGAALLAVQDTIPGLRVVVRDYGILITWEHQIPLGGVRLYDFWKNKKGPKRD